MTINANLKTPNDLIFGPVASRRLGYSLGVDIIPRKTCSLDCVYCEVGKTTRRTLEIAPYITAETVLETLERCLKDEKPRLDFITVTGSGEPTLNSDLGGIVRGIKRLSQVPVAILTNATLLYLEEVREAVSEAEVLVPSLDAATGKAFRAVNRPHPDLDLERILEGLIRLRKTYKKQIWLETLFVRGMNDSPSDLVALKAAAERISPDRIQVNTVVRPPTLSEAHPLDAEELEKCRAFLGPKAELIVSFAKEEAGRENPGSEDSVIEMIRRRPCGLEEISAALNIPRATLEPMMGRLVLNGKAVRRVHRGISFYQSE